MTEIEMLKEMLSMQEEYDQMVFDTHGMKDSYNSVSGDDLYLALFDELGELIHEMKARWCWWKNTQKPEDRKKVLEELVDVVHFVLMTVLRLEKRRTVDEDPVKEFLNGFAYECEQERKVTLAEAVYCTSFANDSFLHGQALVYLHNACGFTWQEVYEAYKKKNAVNRKRVKDGY